MTKDLKFKVLTYMGEFVSLVKISSGIYSTNKPYLYPIEETLDGITESYKKAPYPPSSESFFENLAKCELTDVTLTFNSETKGEQEVFDVYKNIRTEEGYSFLLKSGMFWEFHPELSGDWEQDRLVIFKKD